MASSHHLEEEPAAIEETSDVEEPTEPAEDAGTVSAEDDVNHQTEIAPEPVEHDIPTPAAEMAHSSSKNGTTRALPPALGLLLAGGAITLSAYVIRKLVNGSKSSTTKNSSGISSKHVFIQELHLDTPSVPRSPITPTLPDKRLVVSDRYIHITPT